MFSAVMYQLFAGKMASTSLPASQDAPAMTASVEPPEPTPTSQRRVHYYSGPSNISWVSSSSRFDSTSAHKSFPLGRSASTPSLLHTASHVHTSRAKRYVSSLNEFSTGQSHEYVDNTTQEPVEDILSSDSAEFLQGSSRTPTFPPRAAFFPSHRLSTEMREPLPSPSSAYSAFIRRPLKRSISQSSTMTHRSGAPSIPPLAFGSNFGQGLPVTSSQPSPLKTMTMAFPFPAAHSGLSPIPSSPLPLPPTTLRSHRFSDVSEENDAGSYLTAHSLRDGPRSTTNLAQDMSGRNNPLRFSPSDDSVNDRNPVHLPSMLPAEPGGSSRADDSPHLASATISPIDLDLDRQTDTPMAPSTTLVASTPVYMLSLDPRASNSPSALELYEQAEAAASEEHAARIEPRLRVSVTSSFVDRRWHIGRFSLGNIRLSKISNRQSAAFFAARPLSRVQDDWAMVWTWLRAADASELLFWAGFLLGPWCWLIGGWIVSPLGGKMPNVRQHAAARVKVLGGLSNHGRENLLRISDPESGRDSPESLILAKEHGMFRGSFLWRRRCQIAAAVGFALIMLALIVTTIVMASRA